jgi:branched-chain amino acid transport system ATP-binding protein
MANVNGRSLQADAVSVRFDGLHALADVSLTIGAAEILGLIGPNGAGKTTLVNCLSGFQRPTQGRILLDDRVANDWSAARFRFEGVSRTFQAGRLFKDMTVAENVEVAALALGLSRAKARGYVLDILGQLGIADSADKIAGTLPYTDERRVGIARALIMSPAFILLDEPAAGMSGHECEHLMEIIRPIPKDHRCSVLLIEHNMAVIMGVCDRIHVLDGGRTLASGTPAEMQRNQTVISAYLGSEV